MEKKILSTLFALTFALLLSTVSYAQDTRITVKITATPSSVSTYKTDIGVVNLSSMYVDVQVPYLKWLSRVASGYSTHIYSADNYYKQVILSDYLGRVFYNQLVPAKSTVTVYNS